MVWFDGVFFVILEPTTGLTTDWSEFFCTAQSWTPYSTNKKFTGGEGKRGRGDTYTTLVLNIRNASLTYSLLGERNQRERGGKRRKRVFASQLRLAGTGSRRASGGSSGTAARPPQGCLHLALSAVKSGAERKQPSHPEKQASSSHGNAAWKHRYSFHSILS